MKKFKIKHSEITSETVFGHKYPYLYAYFTSTWKLQSHMLTTDLDLLLMHHQILLPGYVWVHPHYVLPLMVPTPSTPPPPKKSLLGVCVCLYAVTLNCVSCLPRYEVIRKIEFMHSSILDFYLISLTTQNKFAPKSAQEFSLEIFWWCLKKMP